jgi:two-component system, OmpR family, sensor histidine kinase VicK
MFSNFTLLKQQKDLEYEAFRKQSIKYNRENSIYLSVAILSMFIFIHAMWYYFDLSRDFPQEKVFSTNIRLVAIISILNLLFNFFYEKFKFLQKDSISQASIIILSLSILFTSSLNSYVISLNPKNNLTPILIGTIAVSALFRFSIREGIFVFVCGFIFFSSLFFVWNNTEVSFALNLTAIFNIYILAFLINRRTFNNSFKYFKQLRLTESINLTLKNALQQKDEVLEIVAHDLRGPIQNIKYITELISDEKTPDEEKETLIGLINASCVNAQLIINDIISISKIKTTSGPIEIVNLNDSIRTILSEFSSNKSNRKINLNIKDSIVYSRVYEDKLKRILDNLLSNAIKFTSSDKSINVRLYSENQTNIIEVKDEGIGIEEHMRSKLFQKYTEASRTGLNGEQSVGLGLFIVKELSDMMNAKVEFEPNIPSGSIFRIKLPKA